MDSSGIAKIKTSGGYKMIKPIIKDLERVMEQEPTLTASGIDSMLSIMDWEKMNIKEAKQQLEIERKDFLQNFKEFETCCFWLSKFKRIKTPLRSSYYLKHVVEELAGRYISNGVLIAATIYLKIPIRFYAGCINAWIGISKRCPYIKKTTRINTIKL